LLVEVRRLWYGPENSEYRATTTGVLLLDGEQVCYTLEPTSLQIPPGAYEVKLLWSERFSRFTPHLTVPGRSFIEIHGLNRAEESTGCIGIAEKRLNAYVIYEAEAATNAVEEALRAAESNGEESTVQITDLGV